MRFKAMVHCSWLLFAVGALAADIAGSKDHPLVPRYQDSEIIKYEQQAFAEHRLFVSKATAHGGLDKNLNSTTPVEGKVTRITYRAPTGRTALEVFRNYQEAISGAGFQPLFTCAQAECGGRNFNLATKTEYMVFGEHHQEQRYLTAKRSAPEGDAYVAVYVVENRSKGASPNRDRTMVQLDVVEAKPMERRMVVVKAEEIEKSLAAKGRIAIYGVYFDVDKATIRSDSDPQLAEMARILSAQSKLEVVIAGHTDNQGAIDYNIALSKRRAEAVVENLAKRGIAVKRMTAVGVGMAAPVASNRSDEGRGLNRRVELVER
ncbi:MAG TPA: DUF4892 domain-containing protein [Burkholderiales bacterium]|nr:DUF4892 domain-containing protein [Burkholderiales bacterium]